MLLTFDIGNTNIVVGLFDDNKLTHKWRLPSTTKKSVDDYAVDLIELFLTDKIDCLQITGCIIASVVPVLTGIIHEAVKKFTSEDVLEKILIVGNDKTQLDINIKLKNKNEVGHDRLVNAIAGYAKFGGNLIIIDFGTATTFDVVGQNGEYLGGVIAPGINLSLKALHDMTAQLPKISVKPQKNVIGKTTIEAMNSGVYFGYIALVEGLIEKIEKELDQKTTHILTGGLAEIFKDALKNSVKHHEPDLTLEGLQIIYQKNSQMDLNLKKHQNDLLFLPLGGANEIGMNVNLYHLDGKWLMIDCGVGFAYDIPGVDMMTADISFIKAHRKNLVGIILTHIHEDHMGAIQHLWEDLQAPVYATNFGANFLQTKLEEFKLNKKVPIHVIDPSKELDLAPFKIEFIGLTHSVPEMKALMIKTHKGNVLHTGDWKFDPDPVVGAPSEKEKIKAYGDRGEILAVVCDSTNALSAGHSRSEGELYESIKSLIVGRKGLVGVTTFASNIARIHTIARIAKAVGRKIVLAGYSLHRLHEVGKRSGYFMEDFEFINDREMKFYDKNEILVIATGCQGEPNAATRKIATDVHPTIHFVKGDLMIFSSKIIPGNEKKIFELFAELAKKQIDVMTEKDHFVHVSGHPSQEELREMYELARPKIAIPVHGEFLHTKTHCEIAASCGVQRTIQIENGAAVIIDQENPNNSQKVGFVKTGYFGVDGKQLLDFKGDIIRERKKLQFGGIVTVSIVVNDSLVLMSQPKIICVGSYDLKNDREAEDMLRKEIQFFLKNKARELDLNDKFGLQFLKKKMKKRKINEAKVFAELEKSLRSKMLKIFEELMGKRPALEIMIHLVN